MLIPFEKIYQDYNLNIKGIIHLGAHMMQEKDAYNNMGVENIIWVEGNPKVYERIKNLYPDSKIYHHILSEKDNEQVVFKITNNEESSSILDLEKHITYYPDITFVENIEAKTISMKTFIEHESINIDNYNFINLDLQGIELRVLRGLESYIDKIDYIYTEVNSNFLYKDCDLIQDLDLYLSKYNFKRVETVFTGAEWGDAFYIKQV